MAVLLPIWTTKAETARRVRQRIGTVMKWAVAKGYRPDNPAGGAIGAALPKNGSTRQHFRALPHKEVAAALDAVRASNAWVLSKLAFEFLVLTAARSGEVRGARWEEMDFEHAPWSVPAERMKAARKHRVPLSPQAIGVLRRAEELSDGSGLVFPSPTGGVLSPSTLSKLVRELGISAVPHGFRTSFRVWCGDTGVAREVAEAALAHVVRDKVEAAYVLDHVGASTCVRFETRFGMRARRLEKAVVAISETWGETIVPSGGSAANRLGEPRTGRRRAPDCARIGANRRAFQARGGYVNGYTHYQAGREENDMARRVNIMMDDDA